MLIPVINGATPSGSRWPTARVPLAAVADIRVVATITVTPFLYTVDMCIVAKIHGGMMDRVISK